MGFWLESAEICTALAHQPYQSGALALFRCAGF